MSKITQSYLVRKYNDEYRPEFNNALFERSEDEIIQELQNVILSCQKFYGPYTIKVQSFEVIDNYSEIMQILLEYESNTTNGKKKRINQYEYINLKDSDIKLLVVNYHIQAKNKERNLRVYIAVPRIVDKYYFRINGNYYSATLQIVEGSTYNNAVGSSSKPKAPNVVFRTISMRIKMYRNNFILVDVKGNQVPTINYSPNLFSRSFGGFKYILAKYGLYGTFKFSGLDTIRITSEPIMDEYMYSFKSNSDIYISVPKYVYDKDPTTQSLVFTILTSITKDTKLEDVFTRDFWLESLGREFNSATVEKGLSLLSSIEGIYDISTKRNTRLPMEDKRDIYCILRWLMREFPSLRVKDNLDISTRRVRFGEYLASLYATKLSQGIYRLSDAGNKVTVDSIKKVLYIRPTKFIEDICKCNLVNYKNMVNDLDGITATKYSYKDVTAGAKKGEGEKSGSGIVSLPYKMIHPSHLQRVDIDSSSKSDPGMSGVLCPLTDLYDGSFSVYTEPNEWRYQYSEIIDRYRSMVGMKEVIEFKRDILNMPDTENQLENVIESIDVISKLISPIKKLHDITNTEVSDITVLEGGYIQYE